MVGRMLVLVTLVLLAGTAYPLELDFTPAVSDAAPLGASDSKKCKKLLKDWNKKPKASTLTKLIKNECDLPANQSVTLTAGTVFTVNSQSDERDRDPGDGICEANSRGSNQCTLRAAIMEANARGGQDTINIPSGTYQLTRSGREEYGAELGDLNIRDSVILMGAGSASTLIDAAGIDRVFDIRNRSVVKFVGLSIANGNPGRGNGAGISNTDGDLTLEDVIVRNSTTTDGDGGGIHSDGPLRMLRSSVLQNSSATGSGGGIATSNTATLDQVIVRANTVGDRDGGGLFSAGGQLTIINSTFEGNSATHRDGGGIRSNGVTTISSSTFTSNSAGRDGGGIHLAGSNTGELRNVTIHSNRASSRGGGVSSDNVATILNATIVSNSASFEGGGVFRSNGTLNLTNTILWNNTASNCAGGISSAVSNLDSGVSCGFGAGNLTNTDPRLGSLALNGGATQTLAPQSGSPAIDGGTNSNCPAQDQRALSRPADGNSDGNIICDIGAVEITTVSVSPPANGAKCAEFPSHAAAQAFLRANPSDPWNMDANRNGLACEGSDGAGFMPDPRDYTLVIRS
ncbi:MAG: choice-of-anchor Q domain-containing protein [Chloroflexota bacterium]